MPLPYASSKEDNICKTKHADVFLSDYFQMVDQRHTEIPFKNKLTYGAGQVADSLGINGVKQIGHLFYVVLLGMNPAWIGTLLAVMRLWDAFLDPFVGHLSDRLVCR